MFSSSVNTFLIPPVQNVTDIFYDAHSLDIPTSQMYHMPQLSALHINPVPMESESSDPSESNQLQIKTYSNTSSEFIAYKHALFNKAQPDKSDIKCEHYLLNDISTITKFSKIKTTAINTQLNIEHINNMVMYIENNNSLYFPCPIAVIEYTEYLTDTPTNLLEIIDGHHRLECIKILLAKQTCSHMLFWVQLYKASTPIHNDTKQLFRLFNTIKPFKVNFALIDIKYLLVERLNKTFNNHSFVFIKDTLTSVHRPSIQKQKFCDLLEARINILLHNSTQSEDIAPHIIDTIVNNFINYNMTLYNNKKYDWYNTNKNNANKHGAGKLTDKQYSTARIYNCMLGLIDTLYLIEQCVNL